MDFKFRLKNRVHSLYDYICILIVIVSIVPLNNDVLSSDINERGIPALRNFSPEEYGSNPMNWGMVRDHRGILYVANLSGVMEYDGVSWRKLDAPVGSWTLSVASDSAGTIYVGMFGDFGYLSPDSTLTIRTFSEKKTLITPFRESAVFLSYSKRNSSLFSRPINWIS